MKDDIRQWAPDERTANSPAQTASSPSLPPRSPTRVTPSPPWPQYDHPSKQLSLSVNVNNTVQSDDELSSPHSKPLKQNVVKISPSVNPTPQRSQRIKHMTTSLEHKPSQTHMHKRKRSYPTHLPDREPTKTNIPQGPQQPTPNHKETRGTKRSKASHHDITTTTQEPGMPTHITPHANILTSTHLSPSPSPPHPPKQHIQH